MAEFQEVMEIRERMCNEKYGGCDNCPLDAFDDCKIPGIDELEEYEKTIMKWAEDNPEPQYPSWEEWQKEIFPDNNHMIHPCAFMKKSERCIREIAFNCADCRKQPIPADIAKKLHISPIERK